MAPSRFKAVVRVGLLDVRLTRERPGIVTDFVASTVLPGLRHGLPGVKSTQRRTTGCGLPAVDGLTEMQLGRATELRDGEQDLPA